MTIRLSVIAEAARKAHPGPYKACHDGNCKCGMIWSIPDDAVVCAALGSRDEHYTCGEGYIDEAKANNARHIANCDPATVLALVAAVKALQVFVDANDKGPATEWISRMVTCDKAARQALAAFDLSGMEP